MPEVLTVPPGLPQKTIWNRYMVSYDYLNQLDTYREGLRELAESACIRPGLKILDAGSGTGNLTDLLRQRGADVVSLDFSEAALRIHRVKDPEAIQIRASLEEPLPLEASSFDAICCASVLFALSKNGCVSALSEFYRILRPGGTIVLTVACPSKRNGNLLRKHLDSKVRKSGLRGLGSALVEVPQLLRVLYYNRLLQRQPDWNGYHRFNEVELRTMVAHAGFSHIDVTKTYGESFFLLKAQH